MRDNEVDRDSEAENYDDGRDEPAYVFFPEFFLVYAYRFEQFYHKHYAPSQYFRGKKGRDIVIPKYHGSYVSKHETKYVGKDESNGRELYGQTLVYAEDNHHCHGGECQDKGVWESSRFAYYADNEV